MAGPVTETMLLDHYRAFPADDYEPYDAPGVWEATEALVAKGLLRPTGGLRPRYRMAGLGLALLKTEGEALLYDGERRPSLTFWGRIHSKLWQVRRRIRYAPRRLWWALFGDEYY